MTTKRKDDTTPATKADLTALQADLGHVQSGLMSALDGINCTLKAGLSSLGSDIASLKTDVDGLRREMRAEAEATRRHFDLVAERLVTRVSRDHDKIENLDGRVVVIERQLGAVS